MLKEGDSRGFPKQGNNLPKYAGGLSKSTKTLLVMALIILLIGLIWVVVKGITKPNSNQTPVDKLTADLRISNVQIINYTDLNVKIEGNTSAGNLDSVNLIVYGEDNSIITKRIFSIQQLEQNDFQISLHIANTSKIKEISVTPTFVSGTGSKVVGKVEDTYTISNEEKYSGGEVSNEENNSSINQSLPSCTLDSQCNDNNSCTTNTCLEGNCSYVLIENCVPCLSFSQCEDSNNCTTNTCSDGRCVYLSIPGCTQCASSSNCEDNNSCTTNTCFQGRCLYTQIENCKGCTLNSECEDNNPCTNNLCLNNSCSYSAISSCTSCNSTLQCNDIDSSTTNSCLNNKCVYTKITSCINGDGYCPAGCNSANDNDCAFTSSCGNGIREGTERCDSSDLGGATCSGVLGAGYTGTLKCFSGLCTFDTGLCAAPCTCSTDNNACTTDQCVNNICQHTPVSGCCLSNSQCNDNNICTTDTCSGSNTCSYSATPNCCTSNSQCGSGKICTNNICVASTCSGSNFQSCTITNGFGNQTRTCNLGNWSAWGTCIVVSCNSGYHQVGNTCVIDSVAGTYYISTTGSDSGTGSSTSPWRSLAYACAHATTSGNIIHVKAGTYTETAQCNLAVGVSIEGEGASNSIIKSHVTGSVYSNAFTIKLVSSSTTNGNQHISNIKMDGDSLTAYGAIYVEKRSNVEIYSSTFVHFMYYGIGFDGGNSKSGGYFVPPVTYPTGNKIHDCIIDDCSAYYPANEPVNGEGKGAITVDGQEGMLIYNNVLTQTSRAPGNNGYLIKGVAGLNKGLKIFNNTITKAPYDGTTWDFAIELWMCRGGVEIYNNNITGSVDISGSGGELTASTQKTGSYTYGVYIHDNYIHQANSESSEGIRGILIEQSAEDVIIERNHIKSVATGIYMPLGYAGSTLKNIYIQYNIIEDLAGPNWQTRGMLIANPGDYTCDNIDINNNIFIARNTGLTTMQGIEIPMVGTTTNVNIKNNIVQGFDRAPVYAGGTSGETLNYLSIQNNIFYDNGNNNQPLFSGITPNPYTYQNNKEGVNPLFVSSSNFHLQSGSPAINAGINVGLTKDYGGKTVNNPPDIGAYEYTSTSSCTAESNSAFCTRLGKVCGSVVALDNCGNLRTLTSCGSCSTGYTCNVAGQCVASASGTYYISPSGSDLASGSLSAPWRTLAYACAHATTSGNIIHVNAGTYTETSQCNLAPGVSIEGEGATSIIKSNFATAEDEGIISLDSPTGNPINGNQFISYIKMDGENRAGTTGIDIQFRSNVSIHHVTLTNFGYYGVWIFNNNRGYPLPPTITYATGNSIHDSTFINCEHRFEGQSGFAYYNNIHTNGDPKCLTSDWMKGFLIHDNVFTKTFSETGWNFVFETWHYSDNSEIYNNVFNGNAALDLSDVRRGSGTWGLKVHDNKFLVNGVGPYSENGGEILDFEGWGALQYIYVYNNYFKNVVSAIWVGAYNQNNCVYPDGTHWALDHIYIYYNIVDNAGCTTSDIPSIVWLWDNAVSGYSYNQVWDNVFINNNVFTSTNDADAAQNGMYISFKGKASNFQINNNIITGNSWLAINIVNGNNFNNVSVQKNLFYHNGDNSVRWGSTPTSKTENNLINVNPLFVSSSNFHLQSNSPAINKGINVGLTSDYEGSAVNNPPDIGAYEYP